ncbi:CBF/Mak21 family domain containing protein [Amanita muscaria]
MADHDPNLAKDVSKFLNSLKLDDSKPKKTSYHKAVPTSDAQHVKLPEKVTYKHHASLVIQPRSKWYTALPPLEGSGTSSGLHATPERLASLIKMAEQLHNDDTRTFQSSSASNSSSSEAGFLFRIIQSGTLSDRLSALTLLVQSSPLHNVKALETLKSMAERGKGKGGREESLKALRCIVDWWVGGGSPDRKLKYFRDQPLLHPSVTDQHKLAWYFEDWLKKYFFSILQILETLSLDPLPINRHNEQGDAEKSICSRASYHLLQLLQTHPAMKGIVAREIIALVLKPSATPAPAPTLDGLPKGTGKHIRFTDDSDRPKPKSKPPPAKKINGNSHARYYSMITLNQIVLVPNDREVAKQLLDVYFEVFKEVLGETKDDVEEKNQEEEGDKSQSVVLDKAGRVIENSRKGKKERKERRRPGEVKGAAGFTEVEDVNAKLISATITGVNRALPFAKVDAADGKIGKHIDTLFLITHKSTFNISLQALVLIQQISALLTTSSSSLAKSVKDRYYRVLYASLYDTRLSKSSKQAMYLNLLFKSIKADADNMDRVVALVRRLVQVLVSGGNGNAEVVAGGLYLLGEVGVHFQGILRSSKDEKLFSSVPGLRSTIYRATAESDGETYDPRKRDPQFALARSSPLWELTPLLHHYHPAISLHARQLLMSQPITANPDLTENTLSHFLDRFVYKNPKKSKAGETGAKAKGSSAMQPAASGLDGLGVKIMKAEADGASMRIDEVSFLRKKESEIPVDQVFFHRYFTKKNERQQAKATKSGKRKQGSEKSETDNEDGDEANNLEVDGGDDIELDEKQVWKAMKSTMPQVPGDDDEGDLLEDSDELPDLDMSEEDEEEIEGDEEEEESDSDELGLAEGSDNEGLVSLDEEVPEGLIEYNGTEAKEWAGIESEEIGKKRKRGTERRDERKKLRSLPTFASYDEYARMIEDTPEDGI